jgi:hypothetical protein
MSLYDVTKKEKRQTIDLTGLIWRNYSNINIMVMSDYYE